jgi:hypothetical protein
MNTHRLEVLRDTLRTSTIAHTPGRFNLNTWAGNDEIPWEGNPDLSCGTSCCAVGLGTTIPEFAAAGLCLDASIGDGGDAGLVYKCKEDGHCYSSFHAVEKFFELSSRDAYYLFSVGSYPYDATADEVADRIDLFLSASLREPKLARLPPSRDEA